MKPLPPGNILQFMYIKRRLKEYKGSRFLEIGSGNGFLSNELLKLGMNGVGCDLNVFACENNGKLNSLYIAEHSYQIINGNFLEIEFDKQFDIVISSMVIEHLNEEVLNLFVKKIKELLTTSGKVIFLVPSSMKYWGIEDEIAGHVKRYEFDHFKQFEFKYQLKQVHIAGLTYPLSNWLFRLSNSLIKKKESEWIKKTAEERTIYTGNREVLYKTTFPKYYKWVLNPIILYPFYILQLMMKKNRKSLVLYCELTKI